MTQRLFSPITTSGGVKCPSRDGSGAKPQRSFIGGFSVPFEPPGRLHHAHRADGRLDHAGVAMAVRPWRGGLRATWKALVWREGNHSGTFRRGFGPVRRSWTRRSIGRPSIGGPRRLLRSLGDLDVTFKKPIYESIERRAFRRGALGQKPKDLRLKVNRRNQGRAFTVKPAAFSDRKIVLFLQVSRLCQYCPASRRLGGRAEINLIKATSLATSTWVWTTIKRPIAM